MGRITNFKGGVTMANNIAEWFGLKRPNFILEPKKDADFYAPRTGVDIPKLEEGILVNLVTDRPPKRFFWGIYGGGKTHTLFHLIRRLERHLNIYPVYVECPSVPKKSTFLHLYHDGIMANMGQEFVVGIFKKLIEQIGIVRFDELFSKLKEKLEDEELARAVANLLGARSEKELIFWRYISGVDVPKRDLEDLNVTEPLADAIPSRLANILISIGKVVKLTERKTLVLILDELDRLGSVTDEYGASTYEEAFRRLVDENQKDIAIIMSCSARSQRDIPDIFGGEGGPVLSRIGSENIIEIPEISSNDVDTFIKKILEHIVDREKIRTKIDEIKNTTDETLEIEFFPFTREAIEALKGTLRGTMTPREITQRMSNAAGKAFLMKKLVITRDIIGG
jgi:Cdc6-like AAA superfamily ATPase